MLKRLDSISRSRQLRHRVRTLGNKAVALVAGDRVSILSQYLDWQDYSDTSKHYPSASPTTTDMIVLAGDHPVVTHTEAGPNTGNSSTRGADDPDDALVYENWPGMGNYTEEFESRSQLQNLMHYIEGWGNVTHTFNGSIISLYNSKSGIHQGGKVAISEVN